MACLAAACEQLVTLTTPKSKEAPERWSSYMSSTRLPSCSDVSHGTGYCRRTPG